MIAVGPYAVPTVALELRLLTELFRDRPDRYQPINQSLRAKEADHGLLRRGLEAAWVPPDRRDALLNQLAR